MSSFPGSPKVIKGGLVVLADRMATEALGTHVLRDPTPNSQSLDLLMGISGGYNDEAWHYSYAPISFVFR